MTDKKNLVRITRYVIVLAMFALGIWDLVAIWFGTYESTISQQLLGASEISPFIPLAIGFILGHLFWPQRLWSDPKEQPK